MRILVLNWRCMRHPQAGGGEVNVFEQAHRWSASGHDVTVVCADSGPEALPEADELHSNLHVLNMGGRLTVYLRAAWYMLLHGHEYDVVYDVSNGIPFFSPLFTRTPSVLMVHHVHGDQWHDEFPAPVARFGRFLEGAVVPFLYRKRQVITVSASTRSDLDLLGFPEQAVTVVHNGIAPVAPRRRRRDAHDDARILYLGRLKKYKRIDKIIEAAAELRSRGVDVHLDVAGDGDARLELEALVDARALRERVTFHGFVDDETKDRLLASATVFANASTHEGWGISVIEANAYGCPAVAYRVPGLRDAIRHGETGWLAEHDAEFVDALQMLVQEPDVRARLSDAAESWARQFDWDESAKASLALLQCAALRDFGPRTARGTFDDSPA